MYFDESFILPKSLCLCVISYIEDEGMARGSEEMQHMEQNMMIIHECAREEREEGAAQEEEVIRQAESLVVKDGRSLRHASTGVSGIHSPESPTYIHRSIRPRQDVDARADVTTVCGPDRRPAGY